MSRVWLEARFHVTRPLVKLLKPGAQPRCSLGTASNAFIHVTDWHATFCALAGVSAADDVPVQRVQQRVPARACIIIMWTEGEEVVIFGVRGVPAVRPRAGPPWEAGR